MPRLTMDQGEADSPPPRAHLLPAPLPSAPAALSLAHHGGFLSALPLVAEFLVGSDGPLSSLTLGRPPIPLGQLYERRQGEEIYLDACERALAVERARYTILLRLRLVAKDWRDSATGYDRDLRTVSTAPTGDVVPFPFQCIRKLELQLCGVFHHNNLITVMGALELPSWFGNLALEELHSSMDLNFHVPALPALPRLRRLTSIGTDFVLSVESIRDRPLEYIDFPSFHPPFTFPDRPEMHDAVARAFDGTVCGQTLRSLRFHGQPFGTVPEGLRNLRLTALDISFTPVRELPEWLSNHPLVRLDLSDSCIETLPISLRACLSLRFLKLADTALGTARRIIDDDGQVRSTCMRIAGDPFVGELIYMTLSSVPDSEIQRRTRELMAISLALPDLRINFFSETPWSLIEDARDWHAQCGTPWTDPAFHAVMRPFPDWNPVPGVTSAGPVDEDDESSGSEDSDNSED